MIIVSLAGIAVSINFVKIIIFTTVLEPSFLKNIIDKSFCPNVKIYLLFLPKLVDYLNVINSIYYLKDGKQIQQKNRS